MFARYLHWARRSRVKSWRSACQERRGRTHLRAPRGGGAGRSAGREMGISRRSFLHRVGAAGGYGAAYTAMMALGLLPTAAASQVPVMPANLGAGKSVVILG